MYPPLRHVHLLGQCQDLGVGEQRHSSHMVRVAVRQKYRLDVLPSKPKARKFAEGRLPLFVVARIE